MFNKLNAKVHDLENKIPDATTLIHISQYKTDKQDLEKNLLLSLMQKFQKLRRKYQMFNV